MLMVHDQAQAAAGNCSAGVRGCVRLSPAALLGVEVKYVIG
jgi:hypothetical protein